MKPYYVLGVGLVALWLQVTVAQQISIGGIKPDFLILCLSIFGLRRVDIWLGRRELLEAERVLSSSAFRLVRAIIVSTWPVNRNRGEGLVYRVEGTIKASKKAVRDSGSAKTLIGSTSEIHPPITAKNALATYETAKTYAI